MTAVTRRWPRRCAAPGPAIIASGSTVIVALLTLTAADLNVTKSLGPVLAIGVAVGMASMLTLRGARTVSVTVNWAFRRLARIR
jgi:putative drug exporter of the RND superfamily